MNYTNALCSTTYNNNKLPINSQNIHQQRTTQITKTCILPRPISTNMENEQCQRQNTTVFAM